MRGPESSRRALHRSLIPRPYTRRRCAASHSPQFAAALVLAPLGAQAAPRADADVFAGLGTWVDIYDAPAYRSPGRDGSADRRPRRAHRLRRDGERPQRRRRRQPEAARAVRRRAAQARVSASSPGTCPASCSPRVDVRRTRAMLSFRTPHGRIVRRRLARHRVAAPEERRPANDAAARAEPDPPHGGGGHTGRGDHLPVARLRAASDLVARASRGRS